MDRILLTYIGLFLTIAWGTAHLFPTRRVVAGFGEFTADHLRTITMEWIDEGLMLIFVSVLVAVVIRIDRTGPVTRAGARLLSGLRFVHQEGNAVDI